MGWGKKKVGVYSSPTYLSLEAAGPELCRQVGPTKSQKLAAFSSTFPRVWAKLLLLKVEASAFQAAGGEQRPENQVFTLAISYFKKV